MRCEYVFSEVCSCNMWHYFWLHLVYHIVRLSPKHWTRKWPLVFLMLLLSVSTLLPHMYLIALPDFYRRSCPHPIHLLLVVQVILSLAMLGFCVLFVVMEPVIRSIKWAYHIFGLVDLVFGAGFVTTTFLSQACVLTGELVSVNVICLLTVVGTLISTAYFTVLVPFWVWNSFIVKRSLVDPATIDKPEADNALCNGLVKVLPCLCHV